VSIKGEETTLPSLSIPERYRAGVAGLGAMPESAFNDFFTALASGISGEDMSSVVGQLEGSFLSLRDNPDLPEILAAVRSLQSVYKGSHTQVETFPSEIADALSHDAPELAKGIDLKKLSERIEKAVGSPLISITSEKIKSLRSEIERGYCKARILTDLRAAFSDDPSTTPTAMTVLHTLRIRYHDDLRRHREFYIAMDSEDLADLKDAIERAQQKSKTLEAFLGKANCRMLER
jgi:hypothetical protein